MSGAVEEPTNVTTGPTFREEFEMIIFNDGVAPS